MALTSLFCRASDPRIKSEENKWCPPRVKPEGMLILETLYRALCPDIHRNYGDARSTARASSSKVLRLLPRQFIQRTPICKSVVYARAILLTTLIWR